LVASDKRVFVVQGGPVLPNVFAQRERERERESQEIALKETGALQVT
jgi:hypothetical protein